MKLSIAILLTAVLAVSTVQGRDSMNMEELLNQLIMQEESANREVVNEMALSQQDSEEPDENSMTRALMERLLQQDNRQSAILQSTPSNSTMEIQTFTDCPKTAGPFGGNGGAYFGHSPVSCTLEAITEILVRTGSYVNGIRLTTRKASGGTVVGHYHGGNDGTSHTVKLEKGENVVGIFGRYGTLIDQIGFVTDFGRVYGPYGGQGGAAFHVYSCKLRGITGRYGSHLDKIGFLCAKMGC